MSGIAVSSTLKERLVELREEQAEIEKLLERYEATTTSTPKPKAVKTQPKPKAKKTTAKSGRGRGRPPKRANQFISVVEKNPGITVGEAAKQMKVKPNYLYRMSAELVKRGQIVKDGRGFKIA